MTELTSLEDWNSFFQRLKFILSKIDTHFLNDWNSFVRRLKLIFLEDWNSFSRKTELYHYIPIVSQPAIFFFL